MRVNGGMERNDTRSLTLNPEAGTLCERRPLGDAKWRISRSESSDLEKGLYARIKSR